MPPKVPAGAAAAAAAEDDDHESSSSEDEKGEAGKENKQSKLERKSRKAVAKLGLKPITGVTRVTLRRQKSYQVRSVLARFCGCLHRRKHFHSNISSVHHYCPRRL